MTTFPRPHHRTGVIFKGALLSLSLLTILTGATIAPALGSIAEAFPDAPATSIQMILTLPSIFIMLTSIVTGRLAVRFAKRPLVFIGLAMFVVGGVAGRYAPTITLLLLTRVFMGIGTGIITPLSASLISDFFFGEERARMLGFGQAARSLMGVFLTPLVGIIAAENWRNIFWVYLLGGVVFLITLFVVPEPPAEHEAHTAAPGKERIVLPKAVWLLALVMVLQRVGFYIMPTNLSLFLKESAMGGAAAAGWAISVDTLASFLIGLVFASLMKRLGGWLSSLSLLAMGLGYVALALSGSSIVLLYVSMALIGFGEGILMPLLIFQTSQAVSARMRTLAIALVSSMQFLGQFLTPFLFQTINRLGGAETIRQGFWLTALLLCVSALGSAAQRMVKKKPVPAAA